MSAREVLSTLSGNGELPLVSKLDERVGAPVEESGGSVASGSESGTVVRSVSVALPDEVQTSGVVLSLTFVCPDWQETAIDMVSIRARAPSELFLLRPFERMSGVVIGRH
jgi:hypothetical protein